jgi:septal ring factor EnvC (AmiA/AmiB activator)
MAGQQADYSMIYEFMYRIERRISNIEKDTAYVETRIRLLDDDSAKKFSGLHQELIALLNELHSIKSRFRDCAVGMTQLTSELRESLKDDQYEQLASRVDELKFEEFVTHKDLERGV